jgi:hypothetical protein
MNAPGRKTRNRAPGHDQSRCPVPPGTIARRAVPACNLLVTINDGVYSFSAKEVYSIIYQVCSENRNLFIYGNNCANGSPAACFAIR